MTVYNINLSEEDMVENIEEADLKVEADEVVYVGGAGGTGDHRELTNRDAPDSHPIDAITGLRAVVDKVNGIQQGAQVNVIERVEVNGVPMEVSDKAVDIAVPTSYGWTLDYEQSTGKIFLKDKAGAILSTVDTTLERIVKKGRYDASTKEIVLVLDDDSEIRIDAAALVKVYNAGTGLTLGADGVTFNHSNSISEVTEYVGGANAALRIMYDGQGHVKAVSTVAIYPPTSKGMAGQVWVSDGGVGGQWENKPTDGAQGPQGEMGPQGLQGPKGDDGVTPVRGVDYWTDADKQEIVNDVLASIPVAEGGSF